MSLEDKIKDQFCLTREKRATLEEHRKGRLDFYLFREGYRAALEDIKAHGVTVWQDSKMPSRIIAPPYVPEDNDDGWIPLYRLED